MISPRNSHEHAPPPPGSIPAQQPRRPATDPTAVRYAVYRPAPWAAWAPCTDCTGRPTAAAWRWYTDHGRNLLVCQRHHQTRLRGGQP